MARLHEALAAHALTPGRHRAVHFKKKGEVAWPSPSPSYVVEDERGFGYAWVGWWCAFDSRAVLPGRSAGICTECVVAHDGLPKSDGEGRVVARPAVVLDAVRQWRVLRRWHCRAATRPGHTHRKARCPSDLRSPPQPHGAMRHPPAAATDLRAWAVASRSTSSMRTNAESRRSEASRLQAVALQAEDNWSKHHYYTSL